MNLFVTGTDTDIGKTFVTLGLALYFNEVGYKTSVFKPLQSGADIIGDKLLAPDLEVIKKYSTKINTKYSYLLKEATSPALAAELENVEIKPEKILDDYKEIIANSDMTLVEGAGGICVPIIKNFLMADLIKLFDIPIVIVARPDLGTINHTLLTIDYAKSRDIKIQGIIINKYPENTKDTAVKTVVKQFKDCCDTKILGVINDYSNKNLNKDNIIQIFKDNIDFSGLCDNLS